jgi:hypothetical protein
VGGVTKKVRVLVFGLKTLFLKRFTVGYTTRTLIIDKNDHSAYRRAEARWAGGERNIQFIGSDQNSTEFTRKSGFTHLASELSKKVLVVLVYRSMNTVKFVPLKVLNVRPL